MVGGGGVVRAREGVPSVHFIFKNSFSSPIGVRLV